jgi:mgtE-like transporter
MQRQAFKRIIKESTPALVVAAVIDIMAGTAMQLRGIEAWMAIPIFLMLVPSLSDLGNDVVCIISSRITTLLALGVIQPKLGRNKALEANIAAIVIVGVLSSVYLGIINFAIAGVGSVSMLRFLAVCVIAVIMLTLLVCVAAIGVAFVAWRRGLDPDNVTIPIGTSISDLLGIFSLLIAMRIVGFI